MAIAQVLVLQPKLLLMDEPFASLDAIVRMRITQELLGWVEREHLTVLLVTHDLQGDQHVGCRLCALAGPRATIRARHDVTIAAAQRARDAERSAVCTDVRALVERAVMRIRRVLALVLLLAVWESAARLGWLDPFYVPAPSTVGNVMVQLFAGGQIWPHLQATLVAAFGGLRPVSCWAWVWVLPPRCRRCWPNCWSR